MKIGINIFNLLQFQFFPPAFSIQLLFLCLEPELPQLPRERVDGRLPRDSDEGRPRYSIRVVEPDSNLEIKKNWSQSCRKRWWIAVFQGKATRVDASCGAGSDCRE